MKFELCFTQRACEEMDELERNQDKATIFKAVLKILGYMETDLHHPSLHTHKYDSITGPDKEEVFESYVKNRTPEAYRIFWYYGPEKEQITILELCPHP